MGEYDDGPYWDFLLMYGSHDVRHTGFRRLTVVNGTLGFWGVTFGLRKKGTPFISHWLEIIRCEQ